MKEWLYGRNAVYETMRARKRHFFRLRLAQGVEEKGTLIEIMRMASDFKLPVERGPRTRLEALAKGRQGVALEN